MEKKYAVAYVDGSYNAKNNTCGAGIIFDVMREKPSFGTGLYVEYKFYKSTNKEEFTKMRNVGGEIFAASLAILKAISLGIDDLTIYHDYKGIGKWPRREWKANKKATKSYVDLVDSAIKNGLKLYFEHVKAHSGIRRNEMADKLAKKACGIIK